MAPQASRRIAPPLCAPLRPSVVNPFPAPQKIKDPPGPASTFSTAWKIFPRFFHAMENPAESGQAFFHTVENPDFRKSFRPRLLSCRGRGPGGRFSA